LADWDVIVIGGGAAGILAATRAAERGRRVLLIEKNRKPGAKILMSGGSRCNLTQATDRRGIATAFGTQGKFLHSALAAFGPRELIDLVEAEGVPTKVEPTGKVFPASNRAADVLAALMARLDRSGAELARAEPVLEVVQAGLPGPSGFKVTTSQRRWLATKVILTTGGQSYPGCGTTGDGYLWAARMGHSIVPPRPALVPVTVRADWAKSLRGVAVPDAAVCLRQASDEAPSGARHVLDLRRGAILFTHFGLSGPAMLDVSRRITSHPRPRSLQLVCDFLPALSSESLKDQLRMTQRANGRKRISVLLAEHLPRRLADALLCQADVPVDQRAAELSRNQLACLVQAVKSTVIPVTGTLGFEKAEVTAGGVTLDEVDSRTMESKSVPHLFLAGEIHDIDGPIGGYNFQAAFSTAWLAAESV
jgi:predicted Rossmann fold flavoprotein